MAIENFKEIEDYFENNKESEEVEKYLSKFEKTKELNKDNVLEFLKKDDAKDLVNQFANNALDEYKKNKFDEDFETKLKELYPDIEKNLTPEQKKIAELEKKFSMQQKEMQRQQEFNNLKKYASEKGIDENLLNFVKGDTLDEMKLSALSLYEIVNKGGNTPPVNNPEGNTPPNNGNKLKFSIEQIENMSETEINNNWDEIQKTLSQN